MGQTPAQLAAAKKYHKEKLDEMKIYVPKGGKERIQEHAKAQGESLNAFARRAFAETMERDIAASKQNET